MEITYSTMRNCGLVEDSNNIIMHPIHNMIIPLTQINMYLFGINSIPHTVCLQSIIDKNIVIKHNNIFYLILSKLSQYIDMFDSDNLQKYQNKYILINFNNLLNIELEGVQDLLYYFHTKFINFLNEKKPLFHNIIKKMFGDKCYKGQFVDYETNTKIISVKFNYNKPIVVHFGFPDATIPLYVNFNTILNNDSYNKFYEEIKNEILLQDPDQFIVNNLGTFMDISIAQLIVKSHNNKMEHIIPLEQLLRLTIFKSDKLKEEYVKVFKSLYDENTIWCYNNKTVYLNFDGLNKYFLNLELKYLDSFEMKETINTFYSMTMNELIECYKYLYSIK